MAYSTISKPSLHFNTKLFTGNGSNDHAITGVGFQPDWVWIKARNQSYDHMIHDSVRGQYKNIRSNLTNAEATDTSGVKVLIVMVLLQILVVIPMEIVLLLQHGTGKQMVQVRLIQME